MSEDTVTQTQTETAPERPAPERLKRVNERNSEKDLLIGDLRLELEQLKAQLAAVAPPPAPIVEEGPRKRVTFYHRCGGWRSQTASGKAIQFARLFPSLPAAAKTITGHNVNLNALETDAGCYRGFLTTEDPEIIAHLTTRMDGFHPGFLAELAIFEEVLL